MSRIGKLLESGYYRDRFKSDSDSNLLIGGVGDNTKDLDVDSKELEMGIDVESEHTNNSKVAKEIAMDHLTENPRYYSMLASSGIDKHESKKSKNW